MAQAQGVAKLMNSHSKQVRPFAIWGGRKNGLELCPTPTPSTPRPRGMGPSAGQKQPGDPQRWPWPPLPGHPPPPPPAILSFLSAFTYLVNVLE